MFYSLSKSNELYIASYYFVKRKNRTKIYTWAITINIIYCYYYYITNKILLKQWRATAAFVTKILYCLISDCVTYSWWKYGRKVEWWESLFKRCIRSWVTLAFGTGRVRIVDVTWCKLSCSPRIATRCISLARQRRSTSATLHFVWSAATNRRRLTERFCILATLDLSGDRKYVISMQAPEFKSDLYELKILSLSTNSSRSFYFIMFKLFLVYFSDVSMTTLTTNATVWIHVIIQEFQQDGARVDILWNKYILFT